MALQGRHSSHRPTLVLLKSRLGYRKSRTWVTFTVGVRPALGWLSAKWLLTMTMQSCENLGRLIRHKMSLKNSS